VLDLFSWLECATDQQPPAFSLRSKTRMESNSCSWANASTVMAAAGPAPIIAIDFMGAIAKRLY
jgi:hypothetical protein